MAAPIPVYEREVALRPLPTVRPNLRNENALGELPEAIDEVGKAYAKAREEAEQAQLMDAYAQLGKVRQDIEARARKAEGKAALEVDLTKQAGDELALAAGQLAASLPSDRVRAAFQKLRQDQELGLRHAVQGHQAEQGRIFREQSFQGTLATAVDLGVQAAAAAPAGKAAESPEIAAARESILGAVSLRLKDAPAEAREAEIRAALTRLHAGAVERLLDSQRPADAERYLARWRGEMDPAAVGRAEKALKPVQLAEQSRQRAVELEAKFGGNLEQAIAEAQKDPDVSLSDATVQRLLQRNAQIDAARADFQKQALGRIFMKVEKQNGYYSLATDPDYAKLDDAGKAVAEEKLRAIQRQARAQHTSDRAAAAEARREQREADRLALETFRALPLEEQLATDVAAVYPGASPLGLARLQAEQKKSKTAWDKDQGISRQSFLDQVKSLADSPGFKYAHGKNGKPGDFEFFQSHMLEQLHAWEANNPTKTAPTQDEVDAMLFRAVEKQESGARLVRNKERWRLERDGDVNPGTKPLPPEDQPDAVKGLRHPGAAPPSASTSAPAGKVRVVGPGGVTGYANEQGLDEWLKSHPGWSRG